MSRGNQVNIPIKLVLMTVGILFMTDLILLDNCACKVCAEEVRGPAPKEPVPESPVKNNGPVNLLKNAGFEEWGKGKNSPYGKVPPPKISSDGVPDAWESYQAPYESPEKQEFKAGGSLGKDTVVKHDGGASLLMENKFTTDTICIQQDMEVEPDTSYMLKCLFKGDSIELNGGDGCGAIVWVIPASKKDLWAQQESMARNPQPNKGSFDWNTFSFRIDTGSETNWMKIDFQLRRASGRLWMDDVQLIKLEKIKRVETY